MNNNALTKGFILEGNAYSYRIEGILGYGSFGITYLATSTIVVPGPLGSFETEIKVAVKEFFMHEFCSRHGDGTVTEMSEGSLVSGYARKFRKEAENLAKLSHPGIVRVLEVFDANNTCYYSMEYIDGGNLDEYVKREGGLPEQEATSCIRQIADAIDYMHSHRMLHLDLKPLNVMRSADGLKLTLIDFGLSKQYESNGNPESSTSIGLGTPGYAPLEQSNADRDKDFAPTLDVYALGATYYKLLTGQTPPKASDVLNEGLPVDQLQQKGVSGPTITAIERAMEPRKLNRIQSVADFVSLLPSSSGRDERTHIIDPVPQPEPKPQPTPQPEPSPNPTPIPLAPKRHFPKWLIGILCGIAVLAVILILINRKGIAAPTDGPSQYQDDYLNDTTASVSTTSSSSTSTTGTHKGHAYVDLGLSVKWATMNVGATTATGYGDYFAWGETKPKSDYSWSTYKYCKGDYNTLTKYCNNSSDGYNGVTDSKTVLDSSDDAASVNWGGSWRMPTRAEQDELSNTANCTWTWYDSGNAEFNGIAGYKVTSKKSGYAGNYIFLPAAGYRDDTGLNRVGSYGYYWSSSLYTSDPNYAYGLYFFSGYCNTDNSSRLYGQSVRPVCH